MPRIARSDGVGTWHHVMNRGIGRRPIFERAGDVRFFLALLARAVRRRDLEIHAYCVLTTHFHLLVRSPQGRIDRGLGWVEQRYALRFNRRHGRDGPFFRGRFVSRPVTSTRYWRVVVQYIDCNPIEAGLCLASEDYAWGSRRHYRRTEGPPWLTREAIEQEVSRHSRRPYDPEDYSAALPGRISKGLRWVVRRRMQVRSPADPMEVDLIRAAPERVRRGLAARARLADGGSLAAPVASPDAILRALDRHEPCDWSVRPVRKQVPGREVLFVGLLHTAACLRLSEIVQVTGRSRAHAQSRWEMHRALLSRDEAYSRLAVRVASTAVRECLWTGTREVSVRDWDS